MSTSFAAERLIERDVLGPGVDLYERKRGKLPLARSVRERVRRRIRRLRAAQQIGHAVMVDDLLLVIVLGVIAIAVTVDIAVAVAWLRGRWR
jgi:hypothetical protein